MPPDGYPAFLQYLQSVRVSPHSKVERLGRSTPCSARIFAMGGESVMNWRIEPTT